MIKGRIVKILADGNAIAYSTGVNVALSAEAVNITPIPGSQDDDGWLHYEYGIVVWSMSSDGFYSDDDSLIRQMVEGASNIGVEVPVSDSYKITGNCIITEAAIMGSVEGLSRLSVKFAGNDIPKIEQI